MTIPPGHVRTRTRPACWRWRPPTDDAITSLTEKMHLERLAAFGTEDRALQRRGPLEEEVAWTLMHRFQKGRCAVCAYRPRYERLDLDHDHESDFIRGFLCRSCNTQEGCGAGDVFVMYRQRHPAMICGLRARYSSGAIVPPGFILPPCPW